MIILDTHIWIGYIDDPASLPKPALDAIRSGREPVGISSISVWEVFMLERRGRLELRIPGRLSASAVVILSSLFLDRSRAI